MRSTPADSLFRVKIVQPDSAQLPGCGESAPIRANHLNICKFESETDEGYSVVLAKIRRMILPVEKDSTEVRGRPPHHTLISVFSC